MMMNILLKKVLKNWKTLEIDIKTDFQNFSQNHLPTHLTLCVVFHIYDLQYLFILKCKYFSIKFKHSESERTNASARAFAKGIFGKKDLPNVFFQELSSPDSLLKVGYLLFVDIVYLHPFTLRNSLTSYAINGRKKFTKTRKPQLKKHYLKNRTKFYL